MSVVFLFDAFAKQGSIAALVNDTPITTQEFEARKKMIMYFNNVAHLSAEQNRELNHSVLDGLIDEALLAQQGKLLSINISNDEIDSAIRSIEERNKMSQGQLCASLVERQIGTSTFREKIKSELLKNKLLSETLVRGVTITPSEVEAAVLAQSSKDAELDLKILTAKNNDDKTYSQMVSMATKLVGCDKVTPGLYKNIADMTDVNIKLSSLAPQIQGVITDLAQGEHSDVIKVDDQLKIFLICSKKLLNFTDDESNYVINFLGNKKMLIKAKKFQEDLRKKAYIKVKI